jgi:hypothetical protein
VTEGTRQQARGVGGMSRRAAAWMAWALAGLCVAVFLAGVALYVLLRSTQETRIPLAMSDSALIRFVVFNVPFLVFPVVGALIASRRPRNLIGWICLAVGLLASVGLMSELYVAYGTARPGSVPFVATVVALTQWAWVLPVGLMGTYLLLLFPDGRLPSRRWRSLAWLSGVVIVLVGVANVLAPGPLTGLGRVRNPFGIEGAPWLVDATVILSLLFGGCILASAVSLIVRYRRSRAEVREQIKWIALAGSITGALIFLGIALGFLLVRGSMTPEGIVGPPPLWFRLLMYALIWSFASVPVAIGFAVLRYHLYDIDVIINRTLVYGALTATLVTLYFGGVATSQAIFRALTGQEKQPQLAVVVSTLVIAALFNPLRRRVQAFVDRRFYRRKYDAAKTLEAFSARLRDETDLEALNAELVRVVRETMQPAHVSLWLRPETPTKRQQAD